jgi:hypothetical protein
MVRRAGAIAGSQHDRAAAATRFAGNLLLTVAADGRRLVRHSFDRALVANSANPCDRPLESPVFHTAPSEY